ncbi:non-specific lipid-transfer protein 1-like [Gastrolobium bilobum]|uniref:non-specific lipid-transfer protein 1-like n=1 Tax=Gastrolobium bilobum TaxID=150636 RepID=UPI002AAF9423|nr:non-specific lipid-transfer protein 1-like [Gastrolobium bilobum]
MASVKYACMVVMMCMALVGAPMAEAAITCGQVVSSLSPCIPYLSGGGSPSPGCCSGVKNVNAAAKTTADRQAACNCLKTAAGSLAGFNAKNAASLPGKCGVNLPYKISTTTNCAAYVNLTHPHYFNE